MFVIYHGAVSSISAIIYPTPAVFQKIICSKNPAEYENFSPSGK